jgi:hypothetical protein
MVNLSMNRLQAGKKANPTLANLVETLIELAVRRDKKYVGAARKQANHFVGVEQPMPFEQLVVHMAQAVRDGKLVIPIDRKIPLRDARDGHVAVEKGGIGKVLLLA